ncbi:hypothetical protein BEL04_19495 [Mucilaginibacter sp. PPCGB 2223]|uniref:hypothetical protein n=1 Tax=Mucilaginibacter sp. PPCGB 2223 TaxID=1886027 RepID=UPI0008247963|nr:hypothetical protein [Mucilaginibacter sp. PPCGB 2223]OCX50909.1 hypothetical protein BEL04_19495 [Mucilaginibacter sp. PPCGB 2223]
MTLSEIQTGLCRLIKSRPESDKGLDDYFTRVSRSDNLQLVKKIAQWWRMIQIEEFSVLTGNYLRATNMLGAHIHDFLKTEKYSAFRNEVGFQFLNYLVRTKHDRMTTILAELELNLIKQRLGDAVHYKKIWPVDPYEFIDHLMQNNYHAALELREGRYLVTVSSRFKDKVFSVKRLGI